MLLEHGTDINSPGGKLRVFSTAVQNGDSDMLAWLHVNGADPTRMKPDVPGASSYIFDFAARPHKDVTLSFLTIYQLTLSRHYALRAQW
jgi:hypothetical protein